MPVEIRELHIKVTVNQPPRPGNPDLPPAAAKRAEEEKEAIISQCIEEVMELINNKTER